VAIQLKAGMKLRSVTDACQIVVVKAPADPVDLRCGGHPFAAADAEVTPQSVEAGLDGGSQLGKRYASEAFGVEVLCTKGGEGTITIGDDPLELKGAKPLPASD
jgi:hypothetical protein